MLALPLMQSRRSVYLNVTCHHISESACIKLTIVSVPVWYYSSDQLKVGESSHRSEQDRHIPIIMVIAKGGVVSLHKLASYIVMWYST